MTNKILLIITAPLRAVVVLFGFVILIIPFGMCLVIDPVHMRTALIEGLKCAVAFIFHGSNNSTRFSD